MRLCEWDSERVELRWGSEVLLCDDLAPVGLLDFGLVFDLATFSLVED